MMRIKIFLTICIAAVTARETSPEALRTATELMRDIGEGAAPMTPLIDAQKQRAAAAATASSSLFASTHEATSSNHHQHHEPHYSLFASHDASVASASDGAEELRFEADASSLQLQSALADAEGDVVGSFDVIFSESRARSIASNPTALKELAQLTRRALFRLINPFGPKNTTSALTVGAHMIEINVAFPLFVPKQPAKEFSTNATATVQRRQLTINIALRGLSMVQDRSAMSELMGVDFTERLVTLYREEMETESNSDLVVPPTSINTTSFGIVATNIGVSVGCPLLCSSNGACSSLGSCQCYSGYIGIGCAIKSCSHDCGVHGRCNAVNRTCECDSNWFGDSCENEYCPNSCSSRGLCNETSGVCDCAELWTGGDCTIPLCPEDCGGHGKCITAASDIGDDLGYGGIMPKCECDDAWSGDWCASPACPLGDNDLQCSGNALGCIDRTCHCRPGYEGEDCGQESCPNECSQHGDVSNFFPHFISFIFSLSCSS